METGSEVTQGQSQGRHCECRQTCVVRLWLVWFAEIVSIHSPSNIDSGILLSQYLYAAVIETLQFLWASCGFIALLGSAHLLTTHFHFHFATITWLSEAGPLFNYRIFHAFLLPYFHHNLWHIIRACDGGYCIACWFFSNVMLGQKYGLVYTVFECA